jgi:transcription antitermination factor NusG
MQSRDDERRWYALYVRQRYERIVSCHLGGKGYEIFLPTYQSRRRWSDRTKIIETPLFSRYVFCKFDLRDRLPILMVPGVHFVVGFGKTATPVDPVEFDAVRQVVDSGLFCEPWPFVKIGNPVRVESGPLAGLEGLVLEVKKSYKLIISVNLLGRSVAVELDRDSVKPLFGSKPAAHSLTAP